MINLLLYEVSTRPVQLARRYVPLVLLSPTTTLVQANQ